MNAVTKLEPQQLRSLMDARDSNLIAPKYDELLHEVSNRIRQSESIGKADIGALLFWKRLRADTGWVPRLMALSEAEVRAVTSSAVSAANDKSLTLAQSAKSARATLSSLPGFRTGDALASAVLHAAAPHRMAVYDQRAHHGLRLLLGHEVGDEKGRYSRYMAVVDQLTQAVNATHPPREWTPRDVDLALYVIGR
jgi:hypothetical protein